MFSCPNFANCPRANSSFHVQMLCDHKLTRTCTCIRQYRILKKFCPSCLDVSLLLKKMCMYIMFCLLLIFLVVYFYLVIHKFNFLYIYLCLWNVVIYFCKSKLIWYILNNIIYYTLFNFLLMIFLKNFIM